MGNKAGKEGKPGKDIKREGGEEESSEDEDGVKAIAEAAWKADAHIREASRNKGAWDGKGSADDPSARGKLWDAQGKRWMDAKPAGKGGGGGVREGARTFDSGNKYEGGMKDGKYHGHGTLTYADGRRYTGAWHEGVMHGHGMFHYASGDVYVGDYFGGRQEGSGRFVWTNGDVYDGQWKAGKRHGKGKLSKSNGDGYNGMWRQGNPDMKVGGSLAVGR